MPRAFVVGNFVWAQCWFTPRLPAAGETLQAAHLQQEAGGKGLNVAVGLQRLGVQVDALIGCGNDAPAQQLHQLLADEGINDEYVLAFDAASGTGAGFIGADGANAIAVYPGANLLLTAEHAAQCSAAIAQSDVVYGQFETSLPALEAVFIAAHQAGVPTVLNPSPWQKPPAGVLKSTATLIVNEIELFLMLNRPFRQIKCAQAAIELIVNEAIHLWHEWPALQHLVVTLGALGAVCVQRDGMHYSVPALANMQAIDTIGCGDAFAAAWCAARLQNLPLQDCLRWGNAAGGLLASQKGVLAALPTAAQLQARLALTC